MDSTSSTQIALLPCPFCGELPIHADTSAGTVCCKTPGCTLVFLGWVSPERWNQRLTPSVSDGNEAGAALLSKESEEWTVEDRDLYIELVDHEGFGIVTCKNRGFAEIIAAVHNDCVASLQRKLEEATDMIEVLMISCSDSKSWHGAKALLAALSSPVPTEVGATAKQDLRNDPNHIHELELENGFVCKCGYRVPKL